MRRSFDKLSLVARELLGEDPQSGSLYVFVGKRPTRVKVLFWDRNGYWPYKRLYRALFVVPSALKRPVVQIDTASGTTLRSSSNWRVTAMRIEATIPDLKSKQIDNLAEELGVSKSQLIDEALSLFVKAAMEAKLGHRIAIVTGDSREAICELASPSLTQLEWAAHRQKLRVSSKGLERITRALAHAPAPTAALKRAMGGGRRRR